MSLSATKRLSLGSTHKPYGSCKPVEEVSVLVYDVDAVDVTVRCLDVGSVVCGDAGMME